MQTAQSAQRHLAMLTSAFGSDINRLFDDPEIIEIMVNPDGKLWFEALGKGKSYSGIKLSPEQTFNIVKLVASSRDFVIDINQPELSCELPHTGARFQAWIPPVTSAPTFTIRKPATKVFPLEYYLEQKGITQAQVDMLRDAIKNRKNIMIAGGTGSGKTTFANALLYELKNVEERIIVLEDLPELQIEAPDCVILRTTEDKSMRDLVKGTLRMRPDRIIIGEVRDAAALELLKAWNTGHPGGLCTIHANSAESTIDRLEDLLLEAVSTVPKRLVYQAIDVIVFMARNKAGQHHVAELMSIDGEGKFQKFSSAGADQV
ncbi:MAG: P-type conjugative transfer ATPase TrbB [Pseudomonadota bacterium]